MKSFVTKMLSSFLVSLVLVGTSQAADASARFRLVGRYCDTCQTRILQALSKMDGVKSSQFDLESGSAMIHYDEAKVKPEQIIKLIEKEGYKVYREEKLEKANYKDLFRTTP